MAVRPKRVLLCFDGSELSRRALEAAAALVGYGSTLAVANVAREETHEADLILREAREDLLHRGLTATYLPLFGDPADRLVQAALELGADLVVVGRRGREGTPDGALGRVSAGVVNRAPCDVLVVT
ncbi:MAG TPA: universal stress protein [Gaiellaceae bacterium]|jgi:nucleotide-binding universal stress UspA family protein